VKTTDWQGQEYGPGDIVLYAAMSGRCVTMVKAEVLDVYRVHRDDRYSWHRVPDTAGPDGDEQLRVQVKPLGSSRWEQHRGRDYYIDNRTGKRIDPWRSGKHIASGGYEECVKTGTRLDDTGCAHDGCPTGGGLGYHGYDMKRYVRRVFKDYVEKVHEDTKAVTLTVTENITKIAGS
jgi:hypothetical protein